MAKKGQILPRRPLAERLWAKVDKSAGPDGCWLWTGGRRNGFGYGEIWSGGNEGRPLVTHRVAWEATHGPVPEGMQLDHICKNAPCCNPAHLRVVTPRENWVDYSDSPYARNAKKTQCAKGHPYKPETTLYEYREGSVSAGGKRSGRCTIRICLLCFPRHGKRKTQTPPSQEPSE